MSSRQNRGPAGLDATDHAILEILQEDGRIAFSELGRRIGLSQPAVSERVSRMEDMGVIAGYGARINLEAVGLAMTAIIRLKTAHEQIDVCLRHFQASPFITEVHRVTGDDCFVLKAIVPRPEDLAGIVDSIGRFGQVVTSVVLRSEPAKKLERALLRAGMARWATAGRRVLRTA